jgi:hypothetical protein
MINDPLIPPPKDPALLAAENLTTSLDVLSARLEETAQAGEINRRMIWGLVLSLLLSVVLTFALVGVAVETDEASDKADRTHDQQISACFSGNESRALNLELWTYLFNLPPTEPRTAAQTRQINEFRDYISQVFKPRDCTKI